MKGTSTSTHLVDLSVDDLRKRLPEALSVYVSAMGYPRGTADQRAAMWQEHSRRDGWSGVAALDTEHRMVGIGYGYRGAPGQWWQQQVVSGLRRAGAPEPAITALTDSYFELTELHIHPRAQGRGLGEALARRLLLPRRERAVLLSTPEISGDPNRAWRLYRRLGFADVLRDYRFAGDPRPFAILGRSLPL